MRGCIIEWPVESGITFQMIRDGMGPNIFIQHEILDKTRNVYRARLIGDGLPPWCERRDGEGYIYATWGFAVGTGVVVLMQCVETTEYAWPLKQVPSTSSISIATAYGGSVFACPSVTCIPPMEVELAEKKADTKADTASEYRLKTAILNNAWKWYTRWNYVTPYGGDKWSELVEAVKSAKVEEERAVV